MILLNRKVQNFPQTEETIVTEIHNTACSNQFPYIEIEYPPLKLVVDTGCLISIIRPSIAEKHFTNCIYHKPSKTKTGTGEKPIRFKANQLKNYQLTIKMET